MNATQQSPSLAERSGYAVGVGLVFVATLGVYWSFWRPDASPWLWGGGSFAIGALVGAVAGTWRSRRA